MKTYGAHLFLRLLVVLMIAISNTPCPLSLSVSVCLNCALYGEMSAGSIVSTKKRKEKRRSHSFHGTLQLATTVE